MRVMSRVSIKGIGFEINIYHRGHRGRQRESATKMHKRHQAKIECSNPFSFVLLVPPTSSSSVFPLCPLWLTNFRTSNAPQLKPFFIKTLQRNFEPCCRDSVLRFAQQFSHCRI